MLAVYATTPPHEISAPAPVVPQAGSDQAVVYQAWVALWRQMPDRAAVRFVGAAPPPWLQQAYELGQDGHHPDLAFDAMKAINDLFYARRFGEVDRILDTIDETNVPLELLVSLVRFCSSARPHLSHWNQFRERSVREVTRRGREGDTLLR
jgi:hypothetical protein